MGDKTSIEWTDATWNPITGCTKVSPGCDHCYAENIAHRFAGTKSYPNGFDVTLRPERLAQPLSWKRPRRVFVNSMSDLFHDQIPDEYIQRVWEVMWRSPQHTFQVLTKRPRRMRSLLSRAAFYGLNMPWPLPNVWLGVSVEDQKWADIRIPQLLNTPAAVRFISAEPLLGAVDLLRIPPYGDALTDLGVPGTTKLDWVIVGGESGPGARPMHPDWVCELRNQCVENNVPFHFKQWGEWGTLAPRRDDGSLDFSRCHMIANDGTLYAPGDLVYPDGPRYGEAIRAGHDRAHLSTTFRVGKKRAGRELNGRTWDESPVAAGGE